MKRITIGIISALAILLVSSIAMAQETSVIDTTQSLELIKQARQLVVSMAAQDFKAASAKFDDTMKSAMPEDKFAETWKTLIAQVGQFRKQGAVRMEKVSQYDVVLVTCEFEQMELDIKILSSNAGQISGLYFAPTQAAAPKFESASYVNPAAFRKSDVLIGKGEWALSGTLTTPWGNQLWPAVVLVHGSGPNDRDETIGPNKPFRDLAEGLSSKGIAVLRYEKRTKKYAEKMNAMLDSLTVKEEVIDDALEAVKLLKGMPGINKDKIFVLGHSLGGMLAPRIATGDTSIAGLIILAGLTIPLEDAVVDQYNYIFSLKGEISQGERDQLAKLKTQAALVKDTSLSPQTPKTQLPLGLPARYWLDLRNYKPAEAAKNINRPMLIMQGARDYQVTKKDFEGWKKALSDRKDVEFKLYPKLNHLFIAGEGKITPDDYDKAGHVSEEVINDISSWVNAQ